MYQNLTSTWHNAIVDGQTPQEVMLCDCAYPDLSNSYTALNGDFVASSIEIMDEAQPSEDIEIGNTASKLLNISLVKKGGALPNITSGEVALMTGVRTSHTAQTLASGVNQEITAGEYTYTAKTDGFYKDGTKVASGNFVSIVCSIYSFGPGVSVTAYASDGTFYAEDEASGSQTGTASAYNKERFCEKSFSLVMDCPADDGGDVSDWKVTLHRYENGYHDQYLLIPMGIFETNGKVTKTDYATVISDAYDRMSLLDIDVTDDVLEYAADSAYGNTALETMLEEKLGIEIATHAETLLDDCIQMSKYNFTQSSYTLKEFASEVAEYCGGTAIFDREGKFDIMTVGGYDATTYAVGSTRIEQGSWEQADYSVTAVDGICFYTVDGYPYSYPVSANNRYITKSGNEFFTNNASTVCALWHARTLGFASYKPMTADVLEADPSFDSGDLVSVMTYSCPLMTQTLKFTGKWSAEYQAKGHKVMPEESGSSESYNNKVNGKMSPLELLATCTSSTVTQISLPSNMTFNQFSFFVMILTHQGTDVPYQVASEIIAVGNCDINMGSQEQNLHRVCYTNSSDATSGSVRAAGYCGIDPSDWVASMSVTSGFTLELYGAY